MPSCINLRDKYGDTYRVSRDLEAAEGPRDDDPWVFQIRCRRGIIYPYSATRLGLMIDYHNQTATKVAAIRGVECIQNGDKEKTYTFEPKLFKRIAKLVMPYRRRQYTDEQREEMAARARERFGLPTGESDVSDSARASGES